MPPFRIHMENKTRSYMLIYHSNQLYHEQLCHYDLLGIGDFGYTCKPKRNFRYTASASHRILCLLLSVSTSRIHMENKTEPTALPPRTKVISGYASFCDEVSTHSLTPFRIKKKPCSTHVPKASCSHVFI